MSRLLDQPSGGMTYAAAGVSIEQGDHAVERIREAVDSTKRAEVLGGIGGFAGLFALNTKKMKEPFMAWTGGGMRSSISTPSMNDRSSGREMPTPSE